jgi:hypothetical protein
MQIAAASVWFMHVVMLLLCVQGLFFTVPCHALIVLAERYKKPLFIAKMWHYILKAEKDSDLGRSLNYL